MKKLALFPLLALALVGCGETPTALAPAEGPLFAQAGVGSTTGVAAAQSGTTRDVTVSWNTVPGALKYQVEIVSACGATTSIAGHGNVEQSAASVPSHTLTVPAGTASGTYVARVKASGQGNEGTRTDWGCASFTYTAAATVAATQAVTINFTDLAHTYNGSPQGAVFTLSQNVSHTVTYDGSATVPANAGSYAVVVTVNQSGYTGTATGTLVISPAPLTVNIGTSSIVLGNSLPCVASVSGWQGSDNASLITGNAACTVVSSPSTQSGAGQHTLKYGNGLSAGGNYVLSAGNNGTITVTYVGNGFLRPILANGTRTEFRAGSKIPLKFTLHSTTGSVSNAVTTLKINGTPVPAVFRYDATAGQYIFNLDTPSTAAGQTWNVVATADDGVTVFTATVVLTGR